MIRFLLILIISFNLMCCEDVQINGNFKECVIDSLSNMLIFDEDCYRRNDNIFNSNDNANSREIFDIDNKQSAFVFSKHNKILETIGYECKIILHKQRYSKSFAFSPLIDKEIEIVRVSKSECVRMVNEKTCGELNKRSNMTCNNKNECYHMDKIEPEFPIYFGTISKTYYECKFNVKIVIAQNLETNVFHNTIEPCFANDEVCFFEESTVVWEREAIRKCQFERLIDLPNLHVVPNTNGTIYFSSSEQYLFKLNEKIQECEVDFYSTTEGLYLAFYNYDLLLRNKLLSMPISKYDINHFMDQDKSDFLLAEDDYEKYVLAQLIMDMTCSMLVNTVQANRNQEDYFLNLNFLSIHIYYFISNFILNFIFILLAKKNLLIYINYGQAFLPVCNNVSTIVVKENIDSSNCDKEIEILYQKQDSNMLYKGFLRQNNVITPHSSKLPNCNMNYKQLIIEPENKKQNKITITRKSDSISVKNYSSLITGFKILYGNLDNIYDHHSYLVNGSNLMEKIDLLFNPTDIKPLSDQGKSNFFQQKFVPKVSEQVLVNFKNKVTDFVQNFFSNLGFVFFIIIVIFVVLSALLFRAKIKSISRDFSQGFQKERNVKHEWYKDFTRKDKKSSNLNEIEMEFL